MPINFHSFVHSFIRLLIFFVLFLIARSRSKFTINRFILFRNWETDRNTRKVCHLLFGWSYVHCAWHKICFIRKWYSTFLSIDPIFQWYCDTKPENCPKNGRAATLINIIFAFTLFGRPTVQQFNLQFIYSLGRLLAPNFQSFKVCESRDCLWGWIASFPFLNTTISHYPFSIALRLCVYISKHILSVVSLAKMYL